MNLDWQVCSRARLSRDPRFDGKFFIAVLSTGIYCRPICPSRSSKEENIRYYPTAAAAAEAGFRPCMRCRPECSPGTPAWLGTSATVSRALRLIAEGGLEDGVEVLAERLGVGGRHLRRLFLKHLGATPSAVAQTSRLHFAKKLIDETTLPMTQVAAASGYGSVRRFNAGIRQVYNRTPVQLRGLARRPAVQPENHYLFRLRYRPPYHWNGVLDFLAARATPGVEVVEDGVYRRTISVNDSNGYVEVSHDEPNTGIAVRAQFGDPAALFFIIERVRTMFDLNADWPTIQKALETEPALTAIIRKEPGLRVPGCWNGFELATTAVLNPALACKLVRDFGKPFPCASGLTHLFPEPEALAGADSETIRALTKINFQRVGQTAAFLDQLRGIPGFTEQAVQYVAMRSLGEPDAFPSLSTAEPWRSYAAMYLWRRITASAAR